MNRSGLILFCTCFGIFFSSSRVFAQQLSESELIGGYFSLRPDIDSSASLELKEGNKFVLTEHSQIPVYQRLLIFFKTKSDYVSRRGNGKLIGDSLYLDKSTFICWGDSVFFCKIHVNEPFQAERKKICFDLIGKSQIFEPYCRKD